MDNVHFIRKSLAFTDFKRFVNHTIRILESVPDKKIQFPQK